MLMKKEIIKLHNSGLNSEEISKQLDLDKIKVDTIILEDYYNLHPRIMLSLDLLKEAIVSCNSGLTLAAFGKSKNITEAGIRAIFKKANIVFINPKFDYRKWNKETIKSLISDFESGIPVYKLVDKYGFHKNALAKIINENGGNTTKPSFDNNFFNKINTENKAYWLGFLYADGAISSRSNDCEVSLQLLDVEHLFKFKSDLHAKSNVRLDFKVKRCRFNISNKNFKQDLIKWGCPPQKSLILTWNKNLDTLSDDLKIAFIRGYFDGDGCLTHTYSDTKKQRFTVSTNLLGTKSFLTSVLSFLSKFDINGTWYKDPNVNENIITLMFNKRNSVKLLNLLYTNANCYLTRKYEKYLFFKSHKNFAVYVSDYINHHRAISEKAKAWVENKYNINLDECYANTEITKKSNGFLAS